VACHVVVLPLAKETDEEISLELSVKYLREEVQVRNEGGLKNDWDVRGIEELNRVRIGLTSCTLALER
jgi:hypothetical protein